MSITLEQIADKTAQWPDEAVSMPVDRFSLARRREANDEPTDALSEEWKTVINRRYEEMKSGKAKTFTLDETRAIIRKTVGL